MSSKTLTDHYFDPESVRASIIRENYSEMPIRSIASIVERIRSGFWHILDEDPRRDTFFIPESDYKRDYERDGAMLPRNRRPTRRFTANGRFSLPAGRVRRLR